MRENRTAGDGEGGVPKNTRVGHSNLVRGGAGVAAERRDSKTNRRGQVRVWDKKKSKERGGRFPPLRRLWEISDTREAKGSE